MHSGYGHKPDFSVVMCLSRQVDSWSVAPAQDNDVLGAQKNRLIISRVMPIEDPRDGFFSPTLMKDSYSLVLYYQLPYII